MKIPVDVEVPAFAVMPVDDDNVHLPLVCLDSAHAERLAAAYQEHYEQPALVEPVLITVRRAR